MALGCSKSIDKSSTNRENEIVSTAYSIRAVAQKTGLTAHTIRAWERRYGVLEPGRTPTNRRIYDERDVARLSLLLRAVEAGHSIGLVAGLSNDELAQLGRGPAGPVRDNREGGDLGDALENCRRAIRLLDGISLESRLRREIAARGVPTTLRELVVPLLTEVGQGWQQGNGQIAHEHLASAVIRSQLERVRTDIRPSSAAPRLVVTTPAGQVHELGAQLVATMAAGLGWNVTYLGPNLPALEIAVAVRQIQPLAVALSLVFPHEDPRVAEELRKLRSELGQEIGLIVGGAAASGYEPVLREIGARVLSGLDDLPEALSAWAPV